MQVTLLDIEGKQLALDVHGIKVWLDDESMEVTGTIDPESAIMRTTSSVGYSHLGGKTIG
jgi:hypothetical protein